MCIMCIVYTYIYIYSNNFNAMTKLYVHNILKKIKTDFND